MKSDILNNQIILFKWSGGYKRNNPKILCDFLLVFVFCVHCF